MDSWTKADLRGLVEAFADYPIIYNPTHHLYTNRLECEKSMQELFKRVKIFKPKVSILDIDYELRNIQCRYFKEKRIVATLQSSEAGIDEVFVPKLWCSYQLSYLHDGSTSNISTNSQLDVIPSTSWGSLNGSSTAVKVEKGKEENLQLSALEKINAAISMLHDISNNISKQQQSRLSNFFRVVETEMMSLPEELQDQAMLIIMDVIQGVQSKNQTHIPTTTDMSDDDSESDTRIMSDGSIISIVSSEEMPSPIVLD